MANLTSTELKRLHRDWRRGTPGRLAIALDGVSGPFNVGAIIRTAAAYRAETIWLTPGATGPDNPKVGKTALGTDRYCEVVRLDSVERIADAAHSKGLRLVGVELAAGAVPLHELELAADCCLMLGNEDHGISRAGLGLCDDVAFLPQLGKVGSLNVATAAGIAIYEWARQRWTAP